MKTVRSLIILGIGVLLVLTLSGCPEEQPGILVTGVTLDAVSALIAAGGTVQLTATVEPAEATDLSVTWTSSDDAAASVDQNGLVTGAAEGTATITVTTTDGGFTAACEVAVDGTPPGDVTDLEAEAEKTIITLTWTEPDDEDFSAVEITWTPGDSGSAEVAKGTTIKEITGLLSGTEYVFTVKTADGLGNTSEGETVNATTLPSEGLVGEWLFSGNSEDTSGKDNDGTVNGAVLTTDRFGNVDSAYSFDGIDDYIIAQADPLPTAERTVSLWFYTDSIRSDPGYELVGYGGDGSGNSWIMVINYSSNPNVMVIEGHYLNYWIQYGYPTAPAGAWYHWVGTTDSTGTIMYVNGVNVVSTSTFHSNTPVTDKDLCFGSIVGPDGIGPFSDGNASYFSGKLDDIRIYDEALDADDILTLYHEGGWDE